MLRKFLLLDSGAGLFRNLVRNRGLCLRSFSGRRFRVALNGGSLTPSPLLFVDKTPDGPHQMRHGNVDTTLPENLRDPMHAQAATVRFQDLFLVLSQRFNLGLFAVATPVRVARDLKKLLGNGFEMIRISQCESALFNPPPADPPVESLTAVRVPVEKASKEWQPVHMNIFTPSERVLGTRDV